MSVVVNGLAEEDATSQPHNPVMQTLQHHNQSPSSQPHNYHNAAAHIRNPPVAPTLSFSLATPEDEPVDEDEVMISVAAPPPAPPVAVSALNRSSAPNVPNEDSVSTDENTPLLNLQQVVEDHHEEGGDEDDDEEHNERSPLLGSGLQLNMPRRSSSHMGIAFENDVSPGSVNLQQMNGELSPSPTSASGSAFVRSKSESENLSLANNRTSAVSPPTTLNLGRTTTSEVTDFGKNWSGEGCDGLLQTNSHLIEVANKFVCEIISKAKEEALKKMLENKRAQTAGLADVDPGLTELARRFVAEILQKAKQEAMGTMTSEQINNNNNNNKVVKEEATTPGAMEALEIAEPVGEEEVDEHQPLEAGGEGGLAPRRGGRRRRGPWYVQMGRYFSTAISRLCPCRCLGKP